MLVSILVPGDDHGIGITSAIMDINTEKDSMALLQLDLITDAQFDLGLLQRDRRIEGLEDTTMEEIKEPVGRVWSDRGNRPTLNL